MKNFNMQEKFSIKMNRIFFLVFSLLTLSSLASNKVDNLLQIFHKEDFNQRNFRSSYYEFFDLYKTDKDALKSALFWYCAAAEGFFLNSPKECLLLVLEARDS